MTVNGFSLVMSLILFSIICIICCFFLTHTKSSNLWIIAFILVLGLLRSFLPIEFDSSHNLNCWKIYPDLYDLIRYRFGNGISVIQLLYLVWFLGFVVFFIRLLIALRQQINFLRRSSSYPTPKRLASLAAQAAREVGCFYEVKVYTVSDFPTAALIGIYHPVIIIPESMLELSDTELDFILRHEICHYLGNDIWIRLLLQLLLCILWWNPASYLLRRCVIQLLELRSDRRACCTLNEASRINYSQTLITTLKLAHSNYTSFVPYFAGSLYRSCYARRVKNLLTPSPSKPPRWKFITTISLCLLLFLASYTVILQPAYDPPMDEIGMIHTDENSWIVHIADDQYEIWINGTYLGTVSSQSITDPPLNKLPRYEQGESPQ